jgi:hypothetical protein
MVAIPIDQANVTVSINPTIVIHQCTYFSNERYVKMLSAEFQKTGVTPLLYWAEGVAFRYTEMAQNEASTKDLIENNRKHLVSVEFAPMPVMQNEVQLLPNGRALVSPVGNYSVLTAVARQLGLIQRQYVNVVH